MSWQEKLRRLDSEFAAGRISGSEHRRRREDILAEVSGSPLASATPTRAESPPLAPQPGWQATNPAKAADRPPAPQQQQQPEPDPPAPEAPAQPPAPADDRSGTPASALLSTTRRTTAPSPADERPTVMLRLPDYSAAPPASGVDSGHPGPTEPGRDGPRRTGLTWVAISGAVLVALGAVVGGAWWLGQDRTEPPPAAAASPPGQSAEAGGDDEQPALADRIPALPGTPGANDSTVAVDKGVELNLYPEHSATILAEHGVTEVVHRSSTDGATSYFLLVVPTPDERQAASLADELGSLMVGAGFAELDGVRGGLTGTLDDREVRGAWYASGAAAVNLWVSHGGAGDGERLATLTERAVGTLQEALPPA
ncbi:hypothetical protein FFT09_08575 [Saccharomonospora piscinae]|uniref:hypothetical protein n=1 Tax=Saccharomonospora piscinae TaxID=687388 RepID=UPI00110670DE|nr:hypothetical protein [Saccharomonospora piscinae]TLW93440.1 hypothetical protein FFT09_08575 [Saccharomonospora piscinae]